MKKNKQKLIRNPIRFFFKGIVYPLLGWIFVVPFTLLLPRKKNRVLLIGRSGGGFLDNIKYLFLFLEEKIRERELEYYYLTEDKNLYRILKGKELRVMLYPGFKTFWFMMRTRLVIVDNVDWIQRNKYHFLRKSRKIQLWHGVFLKKIELDNSQIINSMNSRLMKIYYTLKGRFPHYDMLLSPSPFFTRNVFAEAIPAGRIYESNYPRTDCFTGEANDLYFIGTDSDAVERMDNFRKKKYKVVLYAPTFRDTGGDAISGEYLDIRRLSDFGRKNHIVFVLKFHRWGASDNPLVSKNIASRENIIFYSHSKDVYPLLPGIDLLITDYSSIYLDYLLLARPVIFFPYDREKYVSRDREFYFDYESMTPGPKCYNQEELETEINRFLKEGIDDYGKEREKLRDLAFKYKDGKSSKRIWDFIYRNYL